MKPAAALITGIVAGIAATLLFQAYTRSMNKSTANEANLTGGDHGVPAKLVDNGDGTLTATYADGFTRILVNGVKQIPNK